jgi:hypothetical protein
MEVLLVLYLSRRRRRRRKRRKRRRRRRRRMKTLVGHLRSYRVCAKHSHWLQHTTCRFAPVPLSSRR